MLVILERTLFAALVACALIGVWPVFHDGRLTLIAAAHGQTAPCTRSAQPEMDVLRCQIQLDADRLGVLESNFITMEAQLALARVDLAAARGETARWREYAKPLYAAPPKPTVAP